MTLDRLNSSHFYVNSLQCLQILYEIFTDPPLSTTWARTIFYSGGVVWIAAAAGSGGWAHGMSDVADSSCCLRQLEVCRSLLVMPLSFVFRGNNCTPRSFWEKSHITDATDPLMLWTYFSTFPSRKFEWQTSGDNSKQWVVIEVRSDVVFSFKMIYFYWVACVWKITLITVYSVNLTFNKSNYCK